MTDEIMMFFEIDNVFNRFINFVQTNIVYFDFENSELEFKKCKSNTLFLQKNQAFQSFRDFLIRVIRNRHLLF